MPLPQVPHMDAVVRWCAHFRTHLYPHYSVESRCFTLVSYMFHSILPCSCLQGVLRSFQVLRRFWGQVALVQGLDTTIEDETRIPNHSQALQITHESLAKSGDHFTLKRSNEDLPGVPFGRIDPNLSEWVKFALGTSLNLSTNGEYERFGRAKFHSP